MSNTDKFLPYRGDLQAITASGGALHLVTTHPEGQATAIYSVELDKLELATDALPCGASAIVADGAALFVAGADGHVYKAGGRGATKALGAALTPAPSGLALVSHDRLAVIAGAELVIVARKDGKELQRLALAEPATAIASDPSGEWIVVGGERGGLAVFEGEGRKDFIASDAKKVHEGPVKALLFEPEELRVLSGGVDSKIFLTHVRGALDPEDRSGKQGHADAVTCMVHGPGDKTYSGGRDGVLKVWTRGQGRASTVKDGVVKSVALVMCEYRGRPHIAVAGDDQTVRLFIVDAAGKPGDRIVTLRGAEAWAQNELGRKEPRAREAALKTIAGWNDAVAIELLGKTAQGDGDHQLKVLATELLGASGNGRAGKHLGGLLKAGEEAVRLRALAGLRALEGMSALGPLRLALGAQKRDIGVVAIQALAGLAARDDLAFDLLVEALGFQPSEVRIAALLALESLSDADSPQADLLALRSKQADVRRLAILRFYQRRMVDRPEVGAALRRHAADADAGVRQVAYLVSLLQVPRLAGALRYRDRQLHRQLHDIESAPAPSFELAAGGAEDEASTAARASLLAALEGRGGGDDEAAEAAAPSGKSGKGGLPKPAKVDASKLTEADMRPLLEAMASRALDTCLAGATGLALLGDPRALGTLLQLSRERDTGVRVEVCKALQALGDPRGAARLRLLMRDSEASVRDAAFSALIKLEDKAPLPIAEAGLLAEHEDIRRRGLDLLVRQLRDARKGGAAASIDAAAATSLLERALGDAAKSVRSEAFKAALNLEIDGGGAGSLRFALRSLQADIRREVLSEVLGQIEQPWAWELLLQLFSDPDPGVRSEAFEFAMKRTRGIGLEPLQAALAGPYADLRTEATKILSKRKAPGISELLAKAARDEDEGVRQLAVEALLVNDADDALVEAMFSPHADVVVKAAAARAIHGDPRALAALVRVVREAEPEIPALQAKWKGRLIAALSGLAELGDPSARSVIVPLLQHKDAAIRSAAADALAWSIRPGEAEGLAALQAALQHSDAAVRTRAALGLAYVGDLAGASILFAQKNQGLETLHAALALGARAHDVFMAFLDQGSDAIRGRALLLLLLQEFAEGDGVPDRCLAALSSAHPRVRLTAAQALEVFGDHDAFFRFVAGLVNDRGDGKLAWTIDDERVRLLAELVTFGDDAGSPQIKVRTAQLLTALDADKQDEFDRRFRIFTERFAAVVKAAEKRAKSRKPAPSAYAPAELRQLVFGAYTGLSRLGVASEAGIRESAIGRLVAAARAGTVPLEAAYAVLVPALSDSAQGVRALAFESLKALGMTPERLATEALGSGQHDVGGMGLDVLARAGGSTGGASVLEDVLRSNNDGLEFEAARLLASFRSGVRAGDGVSLSDADQKALAAAWIGVHTVALDARSESMRSAAVKGLGGAYEAGGQGPAAKALRSALASKYRLVRFAAAEILAQKGDAAAFDVLCEMLASDQAREQTTAIQCLQRLGDPRAPGRFLDRVDNDRSGTARVVDLLRAAGSLRTVADAERLFGFLAEPKTQSPAFDALLTLSGYDQRIEDPSDEGKGPPGWEQRQHPRRDALLARMIDALRTLGDEKLLPRLFAGATWARGKEVDAALAPLVTHAKAELRNPALQALSWRLRRRGADPALVLPALQSGDPVTQFIAAEGLALAGRADGMSVLLAGVDMMPDLGQRRQAVVALGTLADVRALDLLLRLANEEGHALQEQAAEALGHMREAASDRADRVFEVLARLATGSAPGWMKTESLAALLERMAGNAGRNSGVARQALTGLRHYGGRDAWAIIRAAARNANWAVRERAADLLKHNDAPETRELLADVIRSERQYKAIAAAGLSLRHLFGEDSLEPDYVFAESPSVFTLQADIVDRLRSRGDPRRILDLLPKVKNQALLTPLITILTSLSPLPLEAALEGLQSPQELTVAVAARILGTAGPAVAASHGGALVSATEKWAKAWNDEMALLTGAAAGESVDESDEDDDDEYNDDDDDDDYNDDDDDDDEYNDDDDDEYDDDSSDDGDHVANFGVGTGKLAALTAPYVRLLWALGRVGVGEPLLVAATTAGGDDRRGREVRREAVLAIAGGHGELSKLARQNLGVLVRGGDAELRSIAASTLVARDPKAASKLVGELLDDGVSLARLVDGEAAKAAQPALREAATQAASQGLALRYLVELGDVAGLAKILEQKGLGETLRLGVLEALANIASDDAIARLKAFGADEKEDEELRKAARRAVRRARRRQQAAHKAPRRSRWEVQP